MRVAEHIQHGSVLFGVNFHGSKKGMEEIVMGVLAAGLASEDGRVDEKIRAKPDDGGDMFLRLRGHHQIGHAMEIDSILASRFAMITYGEPGGFKVLVIFLEQGNDLAQEKNRYRGWRYWRRC